MPVEKLIQGNIKEYHEAMGVEDDGKQGKRAGDPDIVILLLLARQEGMPGDAFPGIQRLGKVPQVKHQLGHPAGHDAVHIIPSPGNVMFHAPVVLHIGGQWPGRCFNAHNPLFSGDRESLPV